MDLELFDHSYLQGFTHIIGVDEAGRGPLAGPVVAAAVILNPQQIPKGLNDSKKLSEKARLELYPLIIGSAIAYSITFKTPVYIDDNNILKSTLDAMCEAVNSIDMGNCLCLIDGNRLPPHLKHPAICIVKGDAKSASIAAASILAKVYRDNYMEELNELYPQYAFAKHKGYGTKEHLEALELYGPCPQHRMSFKPLVQRTIWNKI